MKAGFIGLGRMGQAMARRMLDAGHYIGVYNRTVDKLKPLTELGAKAVDSIKAAANFGDQPNAEWGQADDAAEWELQRH